MTVHSVGCRRATDAATARRLSVAAAGDDGDDDDGCISTCRVAASESDGRERATRWLAPLNRITPALSDAAPAAAAARACGC